MKVSDIMVVGAVSITGAESVAKAAALMKEQDIGMLVVSNGKHAGGIITDRDIVVRCVGEGHNPGDCTVSAHMSTPVVTVDSETDVLAAATTLREKGVKRLPVTEAGTLTGVISLTDIAQALDQPLHDILYGAGRPRRVAVSVFAGKVSHYYTQLSVAALRPEVPIHTGDQVHIGGRTTDLLFTLSSMEIDHKKVAVAYPGDDVAIKVPERVRPGDSVYVEAPGK